MNTSEMYSEKSEAYYGLVRHDVLALIPAGTKRILDVGCGNGDTGFAAKHLHGAQEVVGIEFFDSAANVAKGKLDKVVTGDIEHLDLDFPESYFDCIICADVLEHTRDPWEVLKKLRRYLDDHGVLIASIPNPAKPEPKRLM